MRDDIPAALPLTAFVLGLACATHVVAPRLTALGLVAIALLLLPRRRSVTLALFAAAGLFAGIAHHERRVAQSAALAQLDDDVFATIEAPLDRGWSRRGSASMLRVERFRANGIDVGEPLSIYVRFEPPPMAMHARVRVEGFVRRSERGMLVATVKSPRLLTYEGELPRWSPSCWNRALAQRLAPFARSYPTGVALAEALALGRGERLADEVREGYKRGGTYHLLVFSGLQIAFAAAAIALLLRWLHAPRAADVSLLLFAAAAPLFIGPSPSIVRSSAGIGLYALSRLLRRPTSLENLWCLSALLRLAFVPDELGDAGFHLTYAGAAALLFFSRTSEGRRHWLMRAMAVELVIAPLTLFHFHQYAFGGSLTTIVLTPFIAAMLVVAFVACALPCAPLFAAIELLHRGCAWVNDLAAHGSGFFAAPPLATMLAGYGGALLAITFLRGRLRVFAIVLALLIPLASTRFQPHDQADSITFLDVGQGDSILVRSQGRTLLVDGGGRNDEARFGESTLLPLLLDRGIRRIDVVLLTHAHPDHCGGLPAVLTHLDVGELWISPRRFRGDCAERLIDAAAARGTPIHLIRDGDTRTLGAIRFQALTLDRTFRRAPDNNASVVLRLQAGKGRILLTGDVERDAERDLAERDLRTDLLKIAHHGSRTSTTSLFLDAASPRVAVISCGRRNLFGHPHPSVVAALRERGIRLWRTDRDGTITIDLGDGPLRVRPQIDTAKSARVE